jgi:hypothetical protein
MTRKKMMQQIRRMGTARGCLEKVLIDLKAGNVRVHPFEDKLSKLIRDLDWIFVEFSETYEGEKPCQNPK